jgi:hypothetical protein
MQRKLPLQNAAARRKSAEEGGVVIVRPALPLSPW